MLITIKDLKQTTFKLEIDTAETVAELKQRIHTERGADYATAHQCLIYAGRILEDGRPLNEYALDENKFIVLMVKRQAIAEKLAAPSEASASQSASVQPRAASSLPPPAVAEPNMLAVAHLVEMGYTRPEALAAMRRCNNHYEHAIEFLLTGEVPVADAANIAVDTSSPTLPSADNPLAFLRDMPEFRQMQQLVRADPQHLHTCIHQIEHTNPELFALIRGNVQHFVEMLSEGMLDDVDVPMADLLADGGVVALQQQQQHDGDAGQSVAIELTPAERQAVQYLMELGFAELEAVQAYLAFEKNEHLAAEFLLEQRELSGPD